MHHVVTAALNRLSVVVLAGGLLAVGAGVVSAAIPSANGTINACYDKQSGQARIVDPSTNQPKGCSQKEAAVTWNVQGPAGQNGVSGYVRVVHGSATNSVGDKTEYADCPDGTKVLGGGAAVYGAQIEGYGSAIVSGIGISQNSPFNETGWAARAEEFVPTTDAWVLEVFALCANVN